MFDKEIEHDIKVLKERVLDLCDESVSNLVESIEGRIIDLERQLNERGQYKIDWE